MKVADLKKELKARGLAVTGNKTELVERLQLAVMPTEASTEEDDSALLEEADNILGEEDEEEKPAAATPAAAAPEKKKVAINRDSALPAMTAAAETEAASKAEDDKPEKKEEEAKKPELPATTPTGKKRSEYKPKMFSSSVLSSISKLLFGFQSQHLVRETVRPRKRSQSSEARQRKQQQKRLLQKRQQLTLNQHCSQKLPLPPP